MPKNESSTHKATYNYRGRFAPSPTGPLHFGSLITALGSFLQARSQEGEWRVRMEDIDPPRVQTGAASDILRTLEAYQLHWDGPVLYQSQRQKAYSAALKQLEKQGDSFPCSCTRASIAQMIAKADTKTGTTTHKHTHPNSDGLRLYPGTCRTGLPINTVARATRLRIPNDTDSFTDSLQGQVNTCLANEVGDFIVRRADGLFAYHLAVVVDDAEQQITEIVRGTDLLSSTAPQRYLQTCLAYPHPKYCHLPVASNSAGQKLSKQTFAAAIDRHRPGPTLFNALKFLGQQPEVSLASAPPAVILAWAVEHWEFQKIPRTDAIIVENSHK